MICFSGLVDVIDTTVFPFAMWSLILKMENESNETVEYHMSVDDTRSIVAKVSLTRHLLLLQRQYSYYTRAHLKQSRGSCSSTALHSRNTQAYNYVTTLTDKHNRF